MLGFDALGRLALGQLPSGATTTTLVAATGTFALTGSAATFRITLATSAGAYVLTGNATTPVRILNGIAGSYVLTGFAITASLTMAGASASYLVTGNAASFFRDYVNWLPSGGITSAWTASTVNSETWTPASEQAKTWITETLAPHVFDPTVFALDPVFDTGGPYWRRKTAPSTTWTDE
jgi:hypothetical protein